MTDINLVPNSLGDTYDEIEACAEFAKCLRIASHVLRFGKANHQMIAPEAIERLARELSNRLDKLHARYMA